MGILPEDALKHDVEEQSTEVCLDSKPHHIEHATDTNGDKTTPGTECRSNPNGELNYMSALGRYMECRVVYANVVNTSSSAVPYGQHTTNQMSNDNCNHCIIPDEAACNHR
jgi:hypothetical protein